MKIIEKAVAAVVRTVDGRPELLVFDHPHAGTQLPKGTIEPGESIAAATLRELEEESGLKLESDPAFIGTWERRLQDGIEGGPAPHIHPWHLSLLEAPSSLPERWSHQATGSPEEEGLVFVYRWVAVDAGLPGKLHPVFEAVARMLQDHLAI
jgi:8-oxo-dGTP pyrophosphatase MutT (NUDIX family)